MFFLKIFLIFVLVVIVLAGVLLLLLTLPWNLVKRFYRSPECADEVHWVYTPDGVRIALFRYRPRVPSSGEPVLCVHGLGANHLNLAFDDEWGVAQFLANRGYDVWAIDLRGRGFSEKPKTPWCFDDYASLDLPSAIEHILKVTGFSQLHWVGHSMGGMLYYAVAGALGYGSRIASAVTIGSPVRFYPLMGKGIPFLLEKLSFLRYFSNPPLAILFFFFPFRRKRFSLLWNPRNMDPFLLSTPQVLFALGTHSIKELIQFANWMRSRRWDSFEGKIDYREGIFRIVVPTLILAGRADRLAPLPSVKPAYDLLSGKKSMIVCGIESGMRKDYGHIDLVFGRYSKQEIFPLILKWIEDHPARKREELALPEEVKTLPTQGYGR